MGVFGSRRCHDAPNVWMNRKEGDGWDPKCTMKMGKLGMSNEKKSFPLYGIDSMLVSSVDNTDIDTQSKKILTTKKSQFKIIMNAFEENK